MITYTRLGISPDYYISSSGYVYSLKSKIFLKINDNGNGYKTVNLWTKGKMRTTYTHRLVAQHYITNPNAYKYVDHIDRDKTNNNSNNLRWVSASENIRNIADKPRYSKGRSAKHLWKYKKDQIIKLYMVGYRVFEISQISKVARQTITGILKKFKSEGSC